MTPAERESALVDVRGDHVPGVLGEVQRLDAAARAQVERPPDRAALGQLRERRGRRRDSEDEIGTRLVGPLVEVVERVVAHPAVERRGGRRRLRRVRPDLGEPPNPIGLHREDARLHQRAHRTQDPLDLGARYGVLHQPQPHQGRLRVAVVAEGILRRQRRVPREPGRAGVPQPPHDGVERVVGVPKTVGKRAEVGV